MPYPLYYGSGRKEHLSLVIHILSRDVPEHPDHLPAVLAMLWHPPSPFWAGPKVSPRSLGGSRTELSRVSLCGSCSFLLLPTQPFSLSLSCSWLCLANAVSVQTPHGTRREQLAGNSLSLLRHWCKGLHQILSYPIPLIFPAAL